MAKRSLAIFVSDQVNLEKMRIPASVLMEAEEKQLAYVMEKGLPRGSPTNIQHDMHRLVGWNSVLGHFIDGSMVRVVGIIEVPENDLEWSQLNSIGARFWDDHHTTGNDTFKIELAQRVSPEILDKETTRFLRIESLVAVRNDLAANLYPKFFSSTTEHVDKDGLTDYRYLIEQLKVVGPGIFLDEDRQLLLFAHRYFRRSLSHLNKLNEYFLTSFSAVASNMRIHPRLRLDPDLIGHPDALKELIELEYWHGPHYSDDIESIPRGVAVHKATDATRLFEGVDKTQIWWKSPEARNDDDGILYVRTFEVEELMDIPAAGLPQDFYGCRYAHAEYSMDGKVITHFDGAIRAYSAEQYLKRIDLDIDHAGKNSQYTKLFRFDGKLEVKSWKRLLSDYFRGNPLIPEYLGEPPEKNNDKRNLGVTATPMTTDSEVVDGQAHSGFVSEEELCAFIHLNTGHIDKDFDLGIKDMLQLDKEQTIPVIETGIGEVDKVLRARLPLASVASMAYSDGRLELVGLRFGICEDFPGTMQQRVNELIGALSKDISELEIKSIALSLTWPHGEILTTLSIRGPSELLLALLSKIFSIVDVTMPASNWIEKLSSAIKVLSPQPKQSCQLDGVEKGILRFPHREGHAKVKFPREISQDLIDKGFVTE